MSTTNQTKHENPMGLDGFEFVEFASTDVNQLITDFQNMGFTAVAKHKSIDAILYQQGDIRFIINNEPNSLAEDFATLHGPAAVAMAFRVEDANAAFALALERGANAYEKIAGDGTLDLPAIYGIGDSLVYFVDANNREKLYADDFKPIPGAPENPKGFGLTYIDHLTHNVKRGHMNKWSEFYERIFNFYEIRYFDIKGKITGLVSRAMTGPCGKLRIPINESTDEQSQIEEFLRDFNGEGIQHIALGTDDIYASIEAMRAQGTKFMSTPDTYFGMIKDRVSWHQEDLERLRKDRILLDGTPTPEGGLLLQIFTNTMLGPVFFEIIQRKGNQGFGEGNFQALFESIERDQIERGVIKKK